MANERTLQELFGDIDNWKSRIALLQKEQEGLDSQIEVNWGEIVRRIKRGESSGDAIRDIVIVKYGQSLETAEKKLAFIQDNLKRFVGQFLLIIKKTGYRWKYSHSPDPNSDYMFLDEFILGVISEESCRFDLSSARIFFPTGGKSISIFKGDFHSHHVDISSDGIGEHKLDYYLLHDERELYDDKRGLRIFIGDEEAIKYLRREATDVLCKACAFLGKPRDAFSGLVDRSKKIEDDLIKKYAILKNRKQYLEGESKINGGLIAQRKKEFDSLPSEISSILAEAEAIGINIVNADLAN